MKTRFIISAIIVASLIGGLWIFGLMQGPIEGSLGAAQISGSNVDYAASRALATGSIPRIMWFVAIAALVITWVSALFTKKKSGDKIGMMAMLALIFVSSTLTGCGDAQKEIYIEVGPSETAFYVPLEGSKDDQKKMMSVAFLQQAKIAQKRITIPQRKKSTGRYWWNYEWVQTAAIIKVNRAPITREWTSTSDTGTSASNQAISVESKESIDFFVGVTCQGSIAEDDTAKYLYHFGGKDLAHVMDENVRGYVQGALYNEFGSRELSEAKEQKAKIFKAAYEDTKKYFKEQGVTIEYLNGSTGLTYKDQKIQDSINKVFQAENDKKAAIGERLAQDERNKITISKAIAAREAAAEFAKNMPAQMARKRLDIEQTYADAALINAQTWDGALPQYMAGIQSGSSLSMFLEQHKVPAK